MTYSRLPDVKVVNTLDISSTAFEVGKVGTTQTEHKWGSVKEHLQSVIGVTNLRPNLQLPNLSSDTFGTNILEKLKSFASMNFTGDNVAQNVKILLTDLVPLFGLNEGFTSQNNVDAPGLGKGKFANPPTKTRQTPLSAGFIFNLKFPCLIHIWAFSDPYMDFESHSM